MTLELLDQITHEQSGGDMRKEIEFTPTYEAGISKSPRLLGIRKLNGDWIFVNPEHKELFEK